MKKLTIILCAFLFLGGCVTPEEAMKGFLGISTRDLEAARIDAAVKVFDYDYDTCYKKTEKIIKGMPKVSVYAQDSKMIAFYYIDPNTTPVGVFFKEAGPGRTQVEIASEDPDAKEWVAKNVFSETILDPTPVAKIEKAGAAPARR